MSSAVASDDFLGADGPHQLCGKPGSTRQGASGCKDLSVFNFLPLASQLHHLPIEVHDILGMAPGLKVRGPRISQFPHVPCGLNFKSDHPEHTLQVACKSTQTFPRDVVTDPTKIHFRYTEDSLYKDSFSLHISLYIDK